eukprot:365676-Chlamydomonas_euryale.AAC.17
MKRRGGASRLEWCSFRRLLGGRVQSAGWIEMAPLPCVGGPGNAGPAVCLGMLAQLHPTQPAGAGHVCSPRPYPLPLRLEVCRRVSHEKGHGLSLHEHHHRKRKLAVHALPVPASGQSVVNHSSRTPDNPCKAAKERCLEGWIDGNDRQMRELACVESADACPETWQQMYV